MRKSLLKTVGMALMIMGCSYTAKADDGCDYLAMSYQKRFECALSKTTEASPLLIMDFENLNAWEAIVKETDALKTTVLEDFKSYSKYKQAFQEESVSSNVKVMVSEQDDPDSKSSSFLKTVPESKMALDDERIASIKIAGIMQNEYKIASNEQGSDAILDSMDLSYSKVMDDFFRGVSKTDVKEISLAFINKFLKAPCENITAKENFDMRRLMLFRETIKETAGLSYYAQARSLDWADLLDDFNSDLTKYTNEGDLNKITRLNFLSRQFLNRLFAMYAQSRSIQAELRTVSRMFTDDTILRRETMEYALEQIKKTEGK